MLLVGNIVIIDVSIIYSLVVYELWENIIS